MISQNMVWLAWPPRLLRTANLMLVVQRIQIAEDVLHLAGAELRIGLGEVVEVGDERLVVPVVVDFHGPGVDMRLQRVEGVGERRQRERPCRCGRGGRRCGGLCKDDTRCRGDGNEAGGGAEKMTAR